MLRPVESRLVWTLRKKMISQLRPDEEFTAASRSKTQQCSRHFTLLYDPPYSRPGSKPAQLDGTVEDYESETEAVA